MAWMEGMDFGVPCGRGWTDSTGYRAGRFTQWVFPLLSDAVFGGVFGGVFGFCAFGFGDTAGWVHSRLDAVKWYIPKIVNIAIKATARHLRIEKPMVD